MIHLWSGKKGKPSVSEAVVAFIQSLDMHAGDELSVCSGALDIVRAYLGERPCCIWKKNGAHLERASERGMIDVFFSKESQDHQVALTRVMASGTSEFGPCTMGGLASDLKDGFDGFLHIPIKTQEAVLGVLTLAVQKKESRDVSLVQPLECLGRLIAMALQSGYDREARTETEKKLKAEVSSTSRELEQTNRKLIERVKELKTLYQELQKRVAELTQANRAKNEFLSIVSHELRTPLTSLTGFLCVLLEGEAGPINEQQKKFLTITKQSATRLNILIGDLLDISRIESGRMNLDMGMLSMVEVLQRSAQDLRGAADKKGISLQLDCPAVLPTVWGDPSRLQQVIDNLVSNAIKFTDKDGRVRVAGEDKGDCIKVSVSDSGIGLSKDDQEKVFDMFYQADASMRRSTGGAGLGLAIARGIVVLHGGQIWVESELGKGATFCFVLPHHKNQQVAA
jgi:signal transduction histidine kinase